MKRFVRAVTSSNALRSVVRFAIAHRNSKRELTGSARAGLFRAFQELDRSEQEQLLLAHFRARADVAVEQWRMDAMPADALISFVDDHCEVSSSIPLEEPVILAAPHYAFYALAALKIGRLFGEKLRVFYNPPDRNPFSNTMTALFKKCGMEHIPLMNDRAGLLQAVRTLRGSGIVAIMPDYATISPANVFVPFFGRFTQAMVGTAYLAAKTGAKIVPMYCTRTSKDTYRLVFEAPIVQDSATCSERQKVYNLTASVYERMESVIRQSPQYWMFWGEFEKTSLVSPPLPRSRADVIPVLTECVETFAKARDFGAAPLAALLSDINCQR